MKAIVISVFAVLTTFSGLRAQPNERVQVLKETGKNKIDVMIGGKLFTSFLYPDSLEKPVLYPVYTAGGVLATRGFPLVPRDGEPTDHPHHIGIWFNYENLNGLDFWNNSYAIPATKKNLYGWIKTDKITQMAGGEKGKLAYQARWVNQNNETQLEETTSFEFSGTAHRRVIDRVTNLKAVKEASFNDAKDGMLGMRLAHELQIPAAEDQKFTDNKGNVTVVKGGTDHVANGNYLTSEGKQGDAAWATRGKWCKIYGKINNDSVSISMIDYPKNPNYPTFWHARGYGLFAANPLGEKIFTNGKSAKNLHLNKGESVTFRYRIVVEDGVATTSARQLNALADNFADNK